MVSYSDTADVAPLDSHRALNHLRPLNFLCIRAGRLDWPKGVASNPKAISETTSSDFRHADKHRVSSTASNQENLS